MSLLHKRYILFGRILRLVRLFSKNPQTKLLYDPDVSHTSLFHLNITEPGGFQKKQFISKSKKRSRFVEDTLKPRKRSRFLEVPTIN